MADIEYTEIESKIIACAEKEFLTKCYDLTTMSGIAKKAGVTRTIMNYYFRTKKRLYEVVIQHFWARVYGQIIFYLGSSAPVDEKMRSIINTYFNLFSEYPLLPRFIINEMHRDIAYLFQIAETNGFGEYLKAAKDMLEKGVTAGTLKPLKFEDYIMTIVSQVIFPFLTAPAFGLDLTKESEEKTKFLTHWKEQVYENLKSMLTVH